MTVHQIVFSRRLRETPFESRAISNGAKAFTIYNHMPLASVYESPQADYAHLCEHVQLWDVSVERQVEVVGADALLLMELITPRDLSKCQVGQCMYAPLVDEEGGIVNDPIVLRLAEDRFWLSIADSDVLLWLRGVAFGRQMDVKVFEPDVHPLAVQGPRSDDLMTKVLGPEVRDIKFFRFIKTTIANTQVLLARSGWSGQGGFEIYLQDRSQGLALWDTIWEAGQEFNIRAGCPNSIERLETGLLSYGSDITLANNPYECGLDRFFKLGKSAEYMSREALEEFASKGVTQKIVHLKLPGDALAPPRSTYPVFNVKGDEVGFVTSMAWSPKFQANLCFAFVAVSETLPANELSIEVEGKRFAGKVCNLGWSES